VDDASRFTTSAILVVVVVVVVVVGVELRLSSLVLHSETMTDRQSPRVTATAARISFCSEAHLALAITREQIRSQPLCIALTHKALYNKDGNTNITEKEINIYI